MNLSCCFELDLLYFFNNNNTYNIEIDEKLKIKILKYINNSCIKPGIPNNNKDKQIIWKEFEYGLSIYFNKEIYMNFLMNIKV